MKSKEMYYSLFLAFLCAYAIDIYSQTKSFETNSFAIVSISTSATKKLESVIGEISGANYIGSTKKIKSGFSNTSHSPGVVSDLEVSSLSKTDISLSWTEVGRDGKIAQASYVEIKIATYPVTYENYFTISSSFSLVFSALEPGSLRQEIVSNLSKGTTYYVAIRVRDSANMYGRISPNKIFATEGVKPKPPMVFSIFSQDKFIISWSTVTVDMEGSPVEIRNYEVYYSSSLAGEIYGPINLSSSTFSYIAPLSPKRWYFVKAVDINGTKSDSSIWLSNFDDVARTVSDEKNAVVEMSQQLNEFLVSKGFAPVVMRELSEEKGGTLSAYRFYLKDNQGNKIDKELTENVTLILPLSADKSISLNSIKPSISYTDYDYAVFYFNGIEDVRLGGSVDPSNGTISVLTKKTGLFKVKRVVRPAGFTIVQSVPKKVFTPNGDGIWDEFHIIYDNDAAQVSIRDAKIYDLSGREIADLKPGVYEAKNSLMWDGKDKDGKLVKSGVYIYQFKAGNKYYNGTVVVAR